MLNCGFEDTGKEVLCPSLEIGADKPVRVMRLNYALDETVEEPILNSHNKAEYEPAHSGGFDTHLSASIYQSS